MFWNDPLTQLALLGMVLTVVVGLLFGLHMGHRYTRLPGGRWTTWEETLKQLAESQEEAA